MANTLLFPILLAIPSFIVIIAGVGFSIFRYRQYPKTSFLTIIALLISAILLIVRILHPTLSMWLVTSGSSPTSITYILGTIGTMASIFGAIAMAILLFAVWSQRES